MDSKSYKKKALAMLHKSVKELHSIGLVDQKTMQKFDKPCLDEIEKLTPSEMLKMCIQSIKNRKSQ